MTSRPSTVAYTVEPDPNEPEPTENGASGSPPAGTIAGSRAWLSSLRDEGPAARDEAIGRLHTLLLGAAAHEVARRRSTLPGLRGGDFDDIAQQAADDALVSVLARLGDFRGLSRFTTWAYKFALLEAAVKLRRLAWQGREIPIDEAGWELTHTRLRPPRSGPNSPSSWRRSGLRSRMT